MLKEEALLSLVNSIEGTAAAAGMKPISEKGAAGKNTILSEEGGKTSVTYTGDLGEVVLELEGIALNVLCRRTDQTASKTVSTELFDYDTDGFSGKEIRSVANEISESIGKFFGTHVVYADKKAGKGGQANAKEDEGVVYAAPAAAKAAVKQAKKVADSFEPIHLALRMESIYPELKGKVEENVAQFGQFLPEEYFEKYGTAPIMDSIRKNDRAVLKRLFKAFNTFYDEGEKDTQSLIAVSILGMNFAQEPELLEKNLSFMNETLGPTVQKIVEYLQKGSAKRKIKAYENPKAYKPGFRERLKKNARRSMLGQ